MVGLNSLRGGFAGKAKLDWRASLIKQFDKWIGFPNLLQQMEKTLLTEMTYGKCTDAENSL